ncbi:hypothetical protein [Vibrio splendidus]|uniref:Uncharacterized protein n=1 Tax=Vibrio splendidus 12E03 TaxID=1191305 RepID=A0A1E5FLC6_VIBSP|nr:hypothetical protein [Vibrio splendidus]OEF90903.1 hypothetical protein A142_22940 [Vibrio splendidus 12E03]
MKEIAFSKCQSFELSKLLQDSGYLSKNRDMCVRYYKGQGDSTFIHHSLNIIRATKSTEGSKFVRQMLGEPNGKASPSQECSYDTWFLNGYQGKAGSKVD